MLAKILLITGTDWAFPVRLSRAFASLGARVEAVCPKANPLWLSSASVWLHPFSYTRPMTAIARAIEAAAPDLVIPCDDLMAELLWRLGQRRSDFAALFARSLGNPGAFTTLSSRNDFLLAAKAAGAPVAETMPVNSAADLDNAIAQLGLPLVLKTDGSWGGDGVVIARDADAAKAAFTGFFDVSRLRSVARAIKRREPHFLVRARYPLTPRIGAQRFVAGHPATSTIASWQGKLLAANHFDVLVSAGTGPATVVQRTMDTAMQETAALIAARFGLSGFFGLDFMRDGDGRVFLLEINPRATPTSHLALGPGHDLAAALLGAVGHPVAERAAVTKEERIVLFPQEIRRDPQTPHLTTGYHDLPLDDPGLTAALAGRPAALTSFSQSFSGLAGLEPAAHRRSR